MTMDRAEFHERLKKFSESRPDAQTVLISEFLETQPKGVIKIIEDLRAYERVQVRHLLRTLEIEARRRPIRNVGDAESRDIRPDRTIRGEG